MTHKPKTLADLQAIYGAGVVVNDRGNGCGGPGYISESDLPIDAQTTAITSVDEATDADAWQLARNAHRDHRLPAPEIVCVGEVEDGGYQAIYSI